MDDRRIILRWKLVVAVFLFLLCVHVYSVFLTVGSEQPIQQHLTSDSLDPGQH